MKTKLLIITALVLAIAVGTFYLIEAWNQRKLADSSTSSEVIDSFGDCVEAGNPVLESYPRKCRVGWQIYTEDVKHLVEKEDMITVESPLNYETVTCPFEVNGKARGGWYFEAEFPVSLCEGRQFQICGIDTVARAHGEWMTEEFVPFTATVDCNNEFFSGKKGVLYLKKANASGLPEYDDQLRIPLNFK